jgi:diaminopimelate decarboxylase
VVKGFLDFTSPDNYDFPTPRKGIIIIRRIKLMLLGTQRITSQGRLEIGGCDTVELARKFGTPLYVIDEEAFRGVCRAYRAAFEKRWPKTVISFSGKAFLNMASACIIRQEGLALDVCSGGELYTALQAGFPADKLIVHGNNKSTEEMQAALSAGCWLMVVDSMPELEQLNDLAGKLGKRPQILIRLSPGVEVDTHTHIRLGQVDTKFGLNPGNGQALAAIKRALALPHLELKGVHCHIGSQILELRPFRETTAIFVEFLARVKTECGVELEWIDLGGGLGTRYLSSHQPPAIEDYAETIVSTLKAELAKRGLKEVSLLQEPGRSLIAEAGTTLYTIGVIKEIPEIRTYVAVDGGLSDNPRPALYDAKYEAIVANKADQPPVATVTISGKHCETDTLIEDITLPRLEAGDILAVQTTGAYNYSMASNYNRFLRPAVVLVHQGEAEIIVEREKLEDLARQDRIPPRLRQATGSR